MYFQPFTPPNPPHLFQVDVPAILFEQSVDAPIAIAAILGSQANDRPGQCILFGSPNQLLA
ncbi:MAG: hypothetical protein OXN84_00150 [Albidovulum sp.]|nr:hypothetical protein [Albidovulum sp.]